MTTPSQQNKPNVTLQAYALVFLALGAGLGALLGYKVGAASDGGLGNLTAVPEVEGTAKVFNWLFFEIGLAAGLVACAVLLAASFMATTAPIAE